MENKKVLHLTLKKVWFDLILSGEKKEEYREVKPYWINRFTWHEYHSYGTIAMIKALCHQETFRKDFDVIEFKNGYGKFARTMYVEFLGIHYGFPAKEAWIDTNKNNWYFCIELGKILSTKNLRNG